MAALALVVLAAPPALNAAPGDAETRACIRELRGLPGVAGNPAHRREAESVCRRHQPGAEWRSCIRERVGRGGNLANPSHAAYTCHPLIEPELRECVTETVQAGTFFNNDALSYCKIPAPGRPCVLDLMSREEVGMHFAKRVCSFRSSDARACIVDHEKARGLFSRYRIRSAHDAEEICQITHLESRECAARQVVGGDRLSEAKLASALCRMSTGEQRRCTELLRYRVPGGDPNQRYAIADAICQQPAYEVRACIFDRLWAGSPTWYGWYELRCSMAFLGNLEDPMDAAAHGIGCELER